MPHFVKEEVDFIAQIEAELKAKVNRAKKRHASLLKKKEPWLPLYQLLAEFLRARKQNFMGEKLDGQFLGTELFDSTGPKSVRTAAASLLSLLWPQEVRNFRLNSPRNLSELKEHKEFYEKVTEILDDLINDPEAALMTSLDELLNDSLIFGTVGLEIFRDEDTVFAFKPWGVQRMSIDEGRKGEVNTISLEVKWDVQRIVDEYGILNVHPKIRKSFNKGEVDEEHRILILIEPRKIHHGSTLVGNMAMSFSSMHIDLDHDHLLRESGFDDIPIKVSRFWKNIDEMYARSAGMNALPDVAEVNAIWESVTIAIEKILEPPLGVMDDGTLGGGEIDTNAGGITVFNISGRASEKNPVFPLFTVGEIKQTVNLIEVLDNSISDHFFIDKLLDFNNETQMTLGEAQIRNRLRNSTLGSVLFRFMKEIFTPMIRRCFNIAFDEGHLGVRKDSPEHLALLEQKKRNILVIPQEIQERMDSGEDVYRIQFFTPAMRLMQAEQAEGILRSWEFAGQLASFGVTSALDNLDEDESVRRMVEIMGAPTEIKRALKGPKGTVESIRAARAKRIQAEEERQQNLEAATMLQQVGNSGLLPGGEKKAA